jgi:1,4-dihydroxy-2-naphthoate octaprenyltransferase
MAITLPFDIRDFHQDRASNLKTIPVLIGKRNSMHLIRILLVIYTLLLFIFAENITGEALALALVTLLTYALIFDKTVKKTEYYYFLLLDGMLLLQFFGVWMVNYLS